MKILRSVRYLSIIASVAFTALLLKSNDTTGDNSARDSRKQDYGQPHRDNTDDLHEDRVETLSDEQMPLEGAVDQDSRFESIMSDGVSEDILQPSSEHVGSGSTDYTTGGGSTTTGFNMDSWVAREQGAEGVSHLAGVAAANSGAISGDDSSTRVAGDRQHVCSQKDRFAAIASVCSKQKSLLRGRGYDQMNDNEINWLARYLKVSLPLKMIGCWTYKTGWSTLNMLFANNSADVPLPTSMLKGNIRFKFKNYGIHPMDSFTPQEKREMLKSYYKFMTVRHPLDRLVSAYVDKIVPRNDSYRKSWGKRIVKKLHKGLLAHRNLSQIYIPFEDIANYISLEGFDMHTDGPYDTLCHPCYIKYDYIMKTETFPEDSDFLVRNHMRGRGLGTKRNNNRPSFSSTFYRPLPEFENVTDSVFKTLLWKYRDDFRKYSYDFEFKHGVLHATCNGTNGCC